MEMEVEKFLGNPSVSSMQFEPMASSYYRAAAHRVAQYYSLVTSSLDGPSENSSVVVARKVGDPRYPPLRLVDIPFPGEKGSNPPGEVTSGAGESGDAKGGQVKLAIRRRPSRGSMAEGGGEGSGSGEGEAGGGPVLTSLPALKSVEERKEEYDRARAMIFNEEKAGGGGGEGEGGGGGGGAEESTAAAAAGTTAGSAGECGGGVSKDEQKKDRQSSGGRGGGVGGRAAEGQKGGEGGREAGRKGRNVAILRDREKEKQDPDFRRGLDR